jgi:hypothetical protein
MTDKMVKWVGAALIGVLLVGAVLLGLWVRSALRERDRYVKLYNECLNAPADTVIMYRDTTIYSKVYIKPVPTRPPDTIVIRDTADRYHYGTFKDGGFTIDYEALGRFKWIRFPRYTCPKEIVTIIKTSKVYDTLQVFNEKNHWGVYMALSGNNFNQFPNMDAGAIFTFNGRFGVMAGGEYNFYDKNIYFRLGCFVNIR